MKALFSVSARVMAMLCLVFSLVLIPAGKAVAASEAPIRIGAVFSLTGKDSFVGPLVGAPMKQAVTAVVNDINGKGGVLGRRIELFAEDDHTNPAAAAAAATRLIRDKLVSVMIGPSITASAFTMIPVCEQEQVPLIVTGPAVTPFEKWVFFLGAGEVRGAKHIAEFAVKTLRAKRIAVLHDTSDYGMSGNRDLLKSLLAYPGVSIVVQDQFAPSDTRVTAQLSRIKAANPDLLILYTNGASAAVIAKEYKQMGMKTRVLGSHGVPTTEFLKLAGSAAEKYGWVMIGSKIVIAGNIPPNDPYRRNLYDPFLRLMKKKYGPSTELSVYQAAAYDGISVAIAAIKAAGTDDRAAVRSALERIRWKGFVGTFACTPRDHQGSPRDDSPAMMVKNGEYVPYER
jgi:branched-chain amino acid transport system substrate-binding protein